MRRTAESRESGFTLLELMVSMLLFGILVAIAVAPYRNYQMSQAHLNSTRTLVGTLRNAQVRAVAENATYRVTFGADGKSWRMARLSSGTVTTGTWSNVGPNHAPGHGGITLRDIAFRQPDGSLGTTVYFYPRGSAGKGSLSVGRDDRAKVYTVSVEGLTARVSYS